MSLFCWNLWFELSPDATLRKGGMFFPEPDSCPSKRQKQDDNSTRPHPASSLTVRRLSAAMSADRRASVIQSVRPSSNFAARCQYGWFRPRFHYQIRRIRLLLPLDRGSRAGGMLDRFGFILWISLLAGKCATACAIMGHRASSAIHACAAQRTGYAFLRGIWLPCAGQSRCRSAVTDP